jgi:hypothetical protein
MIPGSARNWIAVNAVQQSTLKKMKTKTMTTLRLRKSIDRSLSWRSGFLLIPLLLACFALSPTVRATDLESVLPHGNTADGSGVLTSLSTTATNNTAIGFQALHFNLSGIDNTANGYLALWNNASGNLNTAIGFQALKNNTSSINTAVGANALLGNTTGNYNTAIGYSALDSNQSGANNTALGNSSLLHNTSGSTNTAVGVGALYSNTAGQLNTAIGNGALYYNRGNRNIAVGAGAGGSLTTGSDNIDIGTPGLAGESQTIRIGTIQTKVYIEGIGPHDASNGLPVYIDLLGQLGTGPVCPAQCQPSSERFKENIKPMDKASEAILALKPVTFRYKKEFKPKGIPQFGLVAEEVQKVNPDLVVRDPQGKPYGVRYDAVNAMLLNEFLKEHRTVQEQKATIAELKDNFAHQQKQIEALTAGLQKVKTQVEMSKSAPQTVLNNQ